MALGIAHEIAPGGAPQVGHELAAAMAMNDVAATTFKGTANCLSRLKKASAIWQPQINGPDRNEAVRIGGVIQRKLMHGIIERDHLRDRTNKRQFDQMQKRNFEENRYQNLTVQLRMKQSVMGERSQEYFDMVLQLDHAEAGILNRQHLQAGHGLPFASCSRSEYISKRRQKLVLERQQLQEEADWERERLDEMIKFETVLDKILFDANMVDCLRQCNEAMQGFISDKRYDDNDPIDPDEVMYDE